MSCPASPSSTSRTWPTACAGPRPAPASRRHASEVVDAELLRLGARLPGLPPEVRAELSRTVRRVVDTLLHTPTVRVKQLAEGPAGSSYAEALRELFALDPHLGVALKAAAVAGP